MAFFFFTASKTKFRIAIINSIGVKPQILQLFTVHGWGRPRQQQGPLTTKISLYWIESLLDFI